jgi:hypothetical protein
VAPGSICARYRGIVESKKKENELMTARIDCRTPLLGTAYKDGEIRKGKTGAQHGVVLVTIPSGKYAEGKDQNAFVRFMSWDEETFEEFAQIKRGDSVYGEGILTTEI